VPVNTGSSFNIDGAGWDVTAIRLIERDTVFQVMLRDTMNCVLQDSIIVRADTIIPHITIGGLDTICAGDIYSIAATVRHLGPSATFRWSILRDGTTTDFGTGLTQTFTAGVVQDRDTILFTVSGITGLVQQVAIQHYVEKFAYFHVLQFKRSHAISWQQAIQQSLHCLT